ncbi:hypothetical protein RJT34_02782 [Clitoria ternatea]|uniref:Glutaredoxin domain-containing protein n=1 Tax=Clitoria ternatea TaxID=43366 RepID=A0AAN9KLP1_CLITE
MDYLAHPSLLKSHNPYREKGNKIRKMGCASSKRIEAAAAAAPYRPAPTSFAVFDINAIEEPWLKHLNNNNNNNNNTPVLSLTQHNPVLHKLNNILDATEAPQSWDQVSKALQDLKPVITKPPSTPTQPQPQPQPEQRPPAPAPAPTPTPSKSKSFHTIEELDAKLNPKPEHKPKPKPNPETKKPATETNSKKMEVEGENSIKPLKENIFIVRDRLERQKEERETSYERLRRDPLSEFPEKIPPGGNDGVVIYTTSLGGVRKTFEECNRAREVLEMHRVVYDERDVSLHGEFLKEVKELLVGESGSGVVALPRVFVKGRYVGGLDELEALNETGALRRILNATRVERGVGRQGCGGCGGARFVPCFQCAGSCKLNANANGGVDKQRCPGCNENGLVHCPACVQL